MVKPDVAAHGGTFRPAYGNKIISADSNDGDGVYGGFSDQSADDYQQMAGTSMSAPHVAGLAALIIQALGSWNWTLEEALKVKMLISMTSFETQSGERSVPPLDRGDKDNKEGYGRVDADAAIEATTMNYILEGLVSDTLGAGPSDKKVWARQVYLPGGTAYRFSLSVPTASDQDLYLYNGTPDSYGQPVVLVKSVNASLGTDEVIEFTPSASGIYYIVVKWVSGAGTFVLSGTEIIPSRDVAVVDVSLSATEVHVGDAVDITVAVQNYGNVTESFDVTVFYNSSAIETKNVVDLDVNASEILTFSWNTSGV